MNFHYRIKDKEYTLPIAFRRGDKINVKEVFGIKSDKEAMVVDEALWRADEEGVYCELYFKEW